MPNKICMLSTFCDSEKKIEILSENIDLLKKIGMDVMVCSPVIPLPKKIIEKVDFYFLTKENPVIGWPEYVHVNWIDFSFSEEKIRLYKMSRDYGWAAMYQIKTLAKISQTYDYEIYYFSVYDTIIGEEIKKLITSNQKNVFLPFDQGRNGFSDVCTNFFIMDKENLSVISNLIDHELYQENFNAEKMLEKISFSMPNMERKKFPVIRDKIDSSKNWEEKALDLSPHEDFRIYYHKDISDPSSYLKIFFYKNNKEIKNISILIKLNEEPPIHVDFQEYEIIETNLFSCDIKKINLTYRMVDYDQTEVYNTLYWGKIEK